MPDAIFAHPRLAPIYDAFEGERNDLTAYLNIAEELGVEHVLDIGCGTGSLAILLAERGHTVVGLDPAQASLDSAQAKDGAGRVTWIHGDATVLPVTPSALGADLAVLTGNVAQVFLTDNDWAQTLYNIRTTLRPQGRLVFETRRPERRAWQDWASAAEFTLEIPGIGPVAQRLDVTEVRLPFVSFRHTYRFLAEDTVITSDSTLRFRDRDELEASLLAQGYRVLDIRQAPDRPEREFVFLAERAD